MEQPVSLRGSLFRIFAFAAGIILGFSPARAGFYNLAAFWNNNSKIVFQTNLNYSILASSTLYVYPTYVSGGTRSSTNNYRILSTTALSNPSTGASIATSTSCPDPTGGSGAAVSCVVFTAGSTGATDNLHNVFSFTVRDGRGQRFTITVNYVNVITTVTNTWIGATNNNWNTASNWSLAHVPTTSEIAQFKTGDGVSTGCSTNCSPSINASASVWGISLQTGVTLTQGNFPITVSGGAWTQTGGTFNGCTPAGSCAAATISLASAFSFTGGSFNASTAAMTVTGNFTTSTGTFLGRSGSITVTGTVSLSGNFTAPSSTFKTSGNFTFAAGLTFTANTGTLEFAGQGTYTIRGLNGGVTMYNVRFSGDVGNSYTWAIGGPLFPVSNTLTFASTVSSDADTPLFYSNNSDSGGTNANLVTTGNIVVQGYGYKGSGGVNMVWPSAVARTITTTAATVPNFPRFVVGQVVNSPRSLTVSGAIKFDGGFNVTKGNGTATFDFSSSDVTMGCSKGVSTGSSVYDNIVFKSLTITCGNFRLGVGTNQTRTVITKGSLTFANGATLTAAAVSETWNFQVGDGTNASGANLVFTSTGLNPNSAMLGTITFSDGAAHVIDTSAKTGSYTLPGITIASTAGGAVTMNTGSTAQTFSGTVTVGGAGSAVFASGTSFSGAVVVNGSGTGSFTGGTFSGGVTLSGSGTYSFSSSSFTGAVAMTGSGNYNFLSSATFSNAATINGTGSYTFVSGTIFRNGFTYTAGTTNLGSIGQVYLSGALSLGSYVVNNPLIGYHSSTTITGTLNTTGTTYLGPSTLTAGTISVGGNLVGSMLGVVGVSTTSLTLSGTSNASLSGQFSTSLTINKPSGAVTFGNMTLFGDFTYTQAGSVDTTGSIVYLHNGTISASAITFNEVHIGSTLLGVATITGTLNVQGDLCFDGFTDPETGSDNYATVNGGLIQVQGSVRQSNSYSVGNPGTTAITMTGSGAATLGANQSIFSYFPSGTFTINKSAGATVTMASSLTLNAGQLISVSAGTLNLSGKTLDVPTSNGLTVNSGATVNRNSGTLKVGGATVNATANYPNGGGTIN